MTRTASSFSGKASRVPRASCCTLYNPKYPSGAAIGNKTLPILGFPEETYHSICPPSGHNLGTCVSAIDTEYYPSRMIRMESNINPKHPHQREKRGDIPRGEEPHAVVQMPTEDPLFLAPARPGIPKPDLQLPGLKHNTFLFSESA